MTVKKMKVRIVSNMLLDVSNTLLEKFYHSSKDASRWGVHESHPEFAYEHFDITDVYDRGNILAGDKELKPVDFTFVLVPELTYNWNKHQRGQLMDALGFLNDLTTDSMMVVNTKEGELVFDPKTHEYDPQKNLIEPVKYMWLKQPALVLGNYGLKEEEAELDNWHYFLGSRPQCADRLEYFGDMAFLGLDYTYDLIHEKFGLNESEPGQYLMSDFERMLYKGYYAHNSNTPGLMEHHTFVVHLFHHTEQQKQYVRLDTEMPHECEFVQLLYRGEKDFACFHDNQDFQDHAIEMDFDNEVVLDDVAKRLLRTNAVVWAAKNIDQLSLRIQFKRPLAIN